MKLKIFVISLLSLSFLTLNGAEEIKCNDLCKNRITLFIGHQLKPIINTIMEGFNYPHLPKFIQKQSIPRKIAIYNETINFLNMMGTQILNEETLAPFQNPNYLITNIETVKEKTGTLYANSAVGGTLSPAYSNYSWLPLASDKQGSINLTSSSNTAGWFINNAPLTSGSNAIKEPYISLFLNGDAKKGKSTTWFMPQLAYNNDEYVLKEENDNFTLTNTSTGTTIKALPSMVLNVKNIV